MVKAKVDNKDWKNIEVSKWNSTTFKEYLRDLNIGKFGIPCVHGNAKFENIFISNMVKEFGKETVRLFIEECVVDYKGNGNYPTVNFSFMFKYQKANVLPRVLRQAQQAAQMVEARKVEEVVDINYF